jgi:hypothetical protein
MDVNNQGLNIPSNLQNLDVRDELLSIESGSGSACAYSLRDLTGNNLNCVRVRREPEDTTSSIDNERIFSGQEVQANRVEDWVNGKLENTLPVDIDSNNCAGAYSLRKVSSTQVAFNQTSFSDSESIDFIDVNVSSGATLASNVDGYKTKNDLAKFTVTGTDVSVQLRITTESYKAGRTGSTTFEYYIESNSPLVGKYWHIGNPDNQYSTKGVKIVFF